MSGVSQADLDAMEKYALLNALRHSGRAETGAVVSKVLGESPELRTRAKDAARAAAEVVKRVNSLSSEEQQRLLEERYPEAMEGAKKGEPGRREGQLPPLANAVRGSVVLRLPPEPSGYMHIGHAMAGIINHTYKEEYQGKLWLRFEDTNPRRVRPAYYQSFRDGYRWLGISWDEQKNVSSDMELLYEHGRRLVADGSAYACACPMDLVKKLRFEGKACEHRSQPPERNLAIWEEMLSRKHKEGEYVVRLKGDLENLDYSLRDPNIMRIIDAPHPLTGTKYVVWPIYDFENVVEDQVCGVTHVLRSSEFHVALQDRLRHLLGFRQVTVEQFSRFNFKGTPVQKRLLRPLVEEKLVTGWDDPRMPTIKGVVRRGIVPAAIKEFTLQVGYTKAEHTFDWSLLFSVNRKILDPISKRLFFVPDPVELEVRGAPTRKVTIPYHPTNELGSREVEASGRFLVPSGDLSGFKPGDVFRLMDMYNVRLLSRDQGGGVAEYAGDELTRETKKLQWVVDSEPISLEVLEPYALYGEDGTINPESLKVRRGCVEHAFSQLKQGEIVQFPRYGFVRVDAPGTCVLAHT